MMIPTAYAIKRTVDLDHDAAVTRVTELLAKEGFGIMTEIDVAAKMKEKLGRDMPPYRILGACAPPLAWEALGAERDVGVFLPCNVCVYDEEGRTVVSAMEPRVAMQVIGNPGIEKVATEVSDRLTRVVDAV